MSILRPNARAVLIALATLLFGLAPALAEEPMILPTDPAPLVARTADGDKSFSIEIAAGVDERARGLMFRKSMDDDHGMLFVFDVTKPLGFWMQNTPMPLDLLFVGEDGRVIATLPGEPLSEALISPGMEHPARFVLELKRGIGAKNGIKNGDRLSHPSIDAVAGKPG